MNHSLRMYSMHHSLRTHSKVRLLRYAADMERLSGVLLHPTSLPNTFGIGSLGKEAIAWLDWLSEAGQKIWQILPLGHTGYGDSPYQSFSAFAGNPLLVSLEGLHEAGYLTAAEISPPSFPQGVVDYGWVYVWNWERLKIANAKFASNAKKSERTDYQNFVKQEKSWLDDYALFMALKNKHNGAAWVSWETGVRSFEKTAIAKARTELQDEIELYRFVQWQFFKQWKVVRAAAKKKNIRIVGDIPIFVAHDSADVWANQNLFMLQPDGQPTVVAGVPPDYFSATGQLWGNPHYRWDVMQKDGFAWWLKRFAAVLQQVDVVRVDHFRGFDAYWEIPWPAENAVKGQWVHAPGQALFEAVQAKFPDLPVIAEDLGVVTKEVEALRDGFKLPGMKILQFAFYADSTDPFLPHNYVENCVVYTGTHDNDTTLGWWKSEPENIKHKVREYLHVDGTDIVWDMIRAVYESKARLAVVPLQDVLGLDTNARMNLPGRPSGNWGWRYEQNNLSEELAQKLKDLSNETGRL